MLKLGRGFPLCYGLFTRMAEHRSHIGGSPEIYIQLPMRTSSNSMRGLRSLQGHLPLQN